jgi:hypothetical protein
MYNKKNNKTTLGESQSSPLNKNKKLAKQQSKDNTQTQHQLNNNLIPSTTSPSNQSEDPMVTRFKKNAPTCGICYQAIETQGTLDICNHEFCFKCIETWSKTENSCPMCKKRFSKIKNIWKRPYYGENMRKKLCTPNTKATAIEAPNQEIEIPTRNQNSLDGGVLTVERLLNFLIAIFPLDSESLIGRSHIFSVPSTNDNQEISIEIMLHHANDTLTSIPITLATNNSTTTITATTGVPTTATNNTNNAITSSNSTDF